VVRVVVVLQVEFVVLVDDGVEGGTERQLGVRVGMRTPAAAGRVLDSKESAA
jgi:predicted phosphoribosyltransferase